MKFVDTISKISNDSKFKNFLKENKGKVFKMYQT